MINNSNSTKKSEFKIKKDNKDVSDSAKNSKKWSSSSDTPVSKTTPATMATTTNATTDANSKIKKDNKDVSDSAKNNSISILPLEVDELNHDKKDNKDKAQLSYFEKQVLKELKGIRKASKNILKTIKKFNN